MYTIMHHTNSVPYLTPDAGYQTTPLGARLHVLVGPERDQYIGCTNFG